MNSAIAWTAIAGFWCGVLFASRLAHVEALHADDPERRQFRELAALVALAHMAAILITVWEVTR